MKIFWGRARGACNTLGVDVPRPSLKQTLIICALALTLIAGPSSGALAQGREISPDASGALEWEDLDLAPASGSRKISRELEAPPFITEPEEVLQGDNWKVWGQLQLEASWEKLKEPQGKTIRENHAALSTAEIFGQFQPAPFIRLFGHLLHEDGDSGINLDEAFAVLGQTPEFPGYLMGGRVYPAVGLFESYMVSDSITKVVFETQATAVEAGWAGEWLRVSLAGYNPAVRLDGEDSAPWETYLLRVQLAPPEKALGALKLSLGGAYTNNVAASGFFEEMVPGQRLASLPGGLSFSASAEYGPLTLLAEYIRAESFAPGELDYAPPESSPQPWAFNLELSWALADEWRLTGRLEASGDLYSELPQRQAGLCLAWQPWSHLALALEYLRGEFADGSDSDLVTSQLSLIF